MTFALVSAGVVLYLLYTRLSLIIGKRSFRSMPGPVARVVDFVVAGRLGRKGKERNWYAKKG